MKLDITPLLRSENNRFSFEGTHETEIAWDGMGEAITWRSSVSVSGSASIAAGEVLLQGALHLEYQTVCGRCLDPVEVTADIMYKEVFSASADKTPREGYTFRGHDIDLQDMGEDLILLHMPMRHLCKEDCKGLCPICGVNLNYHHCNCAVTPEPASNPFAVLNKLQTQEDEEV